MPNYTDSFAYAATPGNYYCIGLNSAGCFIQSNDRIVTPYNTPYLTAFPSDMVCFGSPTFLDVVCSDNSLIAWDSPLSGSVTPQQVSQPGLYTCTATSCGITTYCSINVYGSSQLLSATINGPDSIVSCNGQSVTLTATLQGGTNVIWSNGASSPSTTVTNDGEYSVQLTDSAGCNTTSNFVYVTIHPALTPLQVTNATVCYQGSTTLYADSLFPVRWYYDASGTQLMDTTHVVHINNVTSNMTFYVQALEDPACPSPLVPAHVYLNTNTSPPNINGDSAMCNFHPFN
jgi:hypothetical protein